MSNVTPDSRSDRIEQYIKKYDPRTLASMLVAVEDRERRARRALRSPAAGGTVDDAAERGRRRKFADLIWRLGLWAAEEQPERAAGYRDAAKEIERIARECWAGFDVESERR